MKVSTCTSVVGVFTDRALAEEAVRALREAGFRNDQISVVTKGREGEGHPDGKDVAIGAAAGAAGGAGVGAGVGALLSLGMAFGVIPVIGPVLAVGPLAAALLTTVGGAALGSLAGALVSLGISEPEAKFYEGEVNAGRTLVVVQAKDSEELAWDVMRGFGAHNYQTATATEAQPVGSR